MNKFYKLTAYISYLVAAIILMASFYYFTYLGNEWSLIELLQKFGLAIVIILQGYCLSKAAGNGVAK